MLMRVIKLFFIDFVIIQLVYLIFEMLFIFFVIVTI